MQIRMENTEALALERIDDFLQAAAEIDFAGQSRREVYEWIRATLVEREYFTLRKKERGQVRSLPGRVSGLSVPQITRLIRQYHVDGAMVVRQFAAEISGQVYGEGFGVVDRGGSGASATQRTGHTPHPGAGMAGFRQARVRQPGGDLAVASLQFAAQRGISAAGGGVEGCAGPVFDW